MWKVREILNLHTEFVSSKCEERMQPAFNPFFYKNEAILF